MNSSKVRYTMGRGSVVAFGLLALTNQGRVGAVGWVITVSPSSAECLVVSESAEIANTAEEIAEEKSETLVALIPDFSPPVEPVPRSFLGS